ncbi:MAG: VCBS repeat-containing protein, partial [Firmicutes bacterium]|nr:VCBS repeat-containing protein [Bacillota bacterium]
MSFADVLGTGTPQLVVSPLLKSVADGVRLLAFEVPRRPRDEPWRAVVLDASLNRMHNHTHVDWNDDGRPETLVACEQGVFLIERTADGTFRKVLVGSGAEGDRPELRGAGEIKVGRGPNGGRFLATIEP